jgi:hypothetical protein
MLKSKIKNHKSQIAGGLPLTSKARIAVSGHQIMQNEANLQRAGWRRQAEGDCMGDCAKQSQLGKVSGSTPAAGGDPSRGRLGHIGVDPSRETKPICTGTGWCVPARAWIWPSLEAISELRCVMSLRAQRSNLLPLGLRLLRRCAPRNDIPRLEIVF